MLNIKQHNHTENHVFANNFLGIKHDVSLWNGDIIVIYRIWETIRVIQLYVKYLSGLMSFLNVSTSLY